MNVEQKIRDMRKTSIVKVIDGQPCTNAEAQTFLRKCVERPNGCPMWYYGQQNRTQQRRRMRETFDQSLSNARRSSVSSRRTRRLLSEWRQLLLRSNRSCVNAGQWSSSSDSTKAT